MIIDYNELEKVVLGSKLENGTRILTYRGNTYFVEPFSENKGDPGENHTSTEGYASDIYIRTDIPRVLKRTVLFHEILEADLFRNQGISKDTAHDIAVKWERIFTNRTIDPKTIKNEYVPLREKEKICKSAKGPVYEGISIKAA